MSTAEPTAHHHHAGAFARLLEAVREGVYIGELHNLLDRGTTIAANPHLKLVLGYSADTPAAEVTPLDPARFADADARTSFLDRLIANRSVTDFPLRMRRLDGTPVWVEVTARAEPSHDGSRVQIEALMRDVSERRRRDDESRGPDQQLIHAEKMAALGQTISGVAHELNNPLTTILSWSERLAERAADDASRRGAEVIQREARRAARIVRNLLTFARMRHSTRSLIDVSQVVRETLAMRAEEQRAASIALIADLASNLPTVLADAHQLQQVVLNLVSNAEQAMAAHGRGTLAVRTSHDPQRGVVVLEVNDDGPGIPPEVRAKIFRPFFTTKRAGTGTGLGLTVASAIVQEHGGRIRASSGPEGGASFVVELPVMRA